MNQPEIANPQGLGGRRTAPLATPTDLRIGATREIAETINAIPADVFARYFKPKNFHWHIGGPHLRAYHLLLDKQATARLAMTDHIAERIRKVGGSTLSSSGHIARLQRVQDNDADYVEPLAAGLRAAHRVCAEH